MRPVVALLSDFGLRDHYAGTMKGVILRICPEATLVDITHDIPPQDVVAGALELAACWRHFPPATIFLAVVDPGVGSARRPIAAAAGGYSFVGPDNGLLAPVLDSSPPAAIVQLATAKYAAPLVSRTFEGRDRFAPAAAWLAGGVPLGELGPALPGYEALAIPAPARTAGGLAGEVVRVDRFGNLITNVSEALLGELGGPGGGVQVVVGGGQAVPVVLTYADAGAGELCALVGSTGHLEVAVNRGSAAQRLGAGRGARIAVVRR